MEEPSKDTSRGCSLGLSTVSSVKDTKTIGSSARTIPQKANASLFSSSLPVLPHEKLNVNDLRNYGQFLDDNSINVKELNQENDIKDSLDDVELTAIGSLLPDEEDLLAGIMDDIDLSGLPDQLDELDDDLFDSGGGMEMDIDMHGSLGIGMSKLNILDGVSANGINHYAVSSSMGSVSGEHPFGEHPSRTLFVRNINSNVEDSELRALFEQYGDIRTLYTACKHRGFVMISYYDIRAAHSAMRAMQNKPLRRRKLDIHFSIPKDNPSDRDINQGTLVVFNLDPSVSNDELLQIFGAYGEVKEIRETPHKRHHKFIEFYDVRAAEAALKALNKSDIAGKRIKLEPSRPGGARRNLMQHISQDLDQEDVRSFCHHVGSPVMNSPPGNWSHFGSPTNLNSSSSFSKSPPVFGSGSPMHNNHLPGLASILPSQVYNPVKMAPIGKDHGRSNNMNQIFNNARSSQGSAFQACSGASHGPTSDVESKTTSSVVGTLSGPQFLWGSPTYSGHASSSTFRTSSTGHSFTSSRQSLGFAYPNCHSSFLASRNHYHPVGSAPSGVPLERHIGFFPESPETRLLSPVVFSGGSLGQGSANYMRTLPSLANASLPVNIAENGSPSFRALALRNHSPVFLGNGSYSGLGLAGKDIMAERARSRRVDNSATQIDMKRKYQLELDKIISGEDTRTTLMIKNIPNKYTSKMLLAAIDENHQGTYDFIYLPIDFKNKCNVGYAFINMLSPSHIVPFYQAFNGKKWEKFNSEKVASLAYARIQGKAALVAHFQNSSLMNEDKRCRPIVFHTQSEESGAQDALLSSNLNVCIHQPCGSCLGDQLESPKGYSDEKSEIN